MRTFFYELTLDKISLLEFKDTKGRTPLIIASRRGHKAAAELLIQYGADVDAQDREGNTALHHACSKGNHAVVSFFISLRGFSPYVQNFKGEAALDIARYNIAHRIHWANSIKCAEILEKVMGDINEWSTFLKNFRYLLCLYVIYSDAKYLKGGYMKALTTLHPLF